MAIPPDIRSAALAPLASLYEGMGPALPEVGRWVNDDDTNGCPITLAVAGVRKLTIGGAWDYLEEHPSDKMAAAAEVLMISLELVQRILKAWDRTLTNHERREVIARLSDYCRSL